MTPGFVAAQLGLGDRFQDVGAYAGLAAILGLAVLSLLFFAQARELKRLREWAAGAAQRDAELIARTIADVQRRMAPAPKPMPAPGATQVVAPPPARPAPPASAPGAAPATTGSPASTAGGGAPPGPGSPAPAPPAAPVPATAAGAGESAPDGPAAAEPPAPAAPGTPAPAEEGAPAAKPAPSGTPAPAAPAPTPAPTPGKAPPPAAPGPAGAPTPPPGRPPAPRPGVRPAPAPVPAPVPAPATAAAGSVPAAAPSAPAAPNGATGRSAPLRIPTNAATLPPRPGRDAPRRSRLPLVGAGVAVVAALGVVAVLVFGGDDSPVPQTNQIGTAGPAQPTTSGGGTGPTSAPLDRGSIPVAVFNGTTFNGLAREASDVLQRRGYEVPITETDETDQSRQTTQVFYADGRRRYGLDVARALEVPNTAVMAMDDNARTLAAGNQVLVLIGADKAQ